MRRDSDVEEEEEWEEDFSHDLNGPNLGPDSSSFLAMRKPYRHDSLEEPLLSRQMSMGSLSRDHKLGDRRSQRIYMRSEDLAAVFTGYSTSMPGFVFYVILCTLTLGLAYLVFRWLPKWRIRLVGRRTPFGKCQWITIKVREAIRPLASIDDG